MRTDVIVKAVGTKGQGVFALRDFTIGEFILRRRYGRIMHNQEIALLSQEEQRHLCELDWDTSAVLLPPGCYFNHACDPNAMRKGTHVFAWQPIRQGDEITIDYRLNAFTNERCECSCGSANCTGSFILSFFALSDDRQRMYLPYAPKFIRTEYRRRHGRVIAKDSR
jgi:hypothetical protein